MSHLKEYVEGLNRIAAIFGSDPIDMDNLDNAAAQKIFDLIDCDLSPENLCCDGELPFAQVQKKAKMLNGAKAELIALGFQHCAEFGSPDPFSLNYKGR